MLATHCTELGFDVLGTVFTVRYTAPVRANVLHDLDWSMTAVTLHRSGGHLIDWSGRVRARRDGRIAIEATGQVLVMSTPI
jgi:hypothetical protein